MLIQFSDSAHHDSNTRSKAERAEDKHSDGPAVDLKKFFSVTPPTAPAALDLTRQLCQQYLGGVWGDGQAQIRLKVITGGMSNLLFLVELTAEDENVPPAEGEQPRQVLMRIHCQTDDEERTKEDNDIFRRVAERGLGPRLHAILPGGRFEEFFASSRPLTCQELFHPERAAAIAPLLARIHAKMDHPGRSGGCGSGEAQLVPIMSGWLRKLQSILGREEMERSYGNLELHRDFVASWLRDKCTSPVVFCHNDLQEGNILLRVEHETGKDDMLTLIDFEYGNLNYRGFDIANHFCEYGYDYDCAEPPYFRIYEEKFDSLSPDVKLVRAAFCRAYLDEMNQLSPCDGLLSGKLAVDLPILLHEAHQFMPICDFFWGIWSLLQAETSPLSFDYKNYGKVRLERFLTEKNRLDE